MSFVRTVVRSGILQQGSTTFQDRLQRSQAPIVVLLCREQLSTQIEQRHEFPSENIRRFESIGIEQNFSDEFIVRLGHGHGTEQLFEIVGQFRSTTVPFACWIQRDEYARVRIDLNATLEQSQCGRAAFQSILNNLNLHRHGGEDSFVQSIELIETTPSV